MIVLSESDRAKIVDPRKRSSFSQSYKASFTDTKGHKHETLYFSTSKQANAKVEKVVRSAYRVAGEVKVRYQ